jgi:hypothetical protein
MAGGADVLKKYAKILTKNGCGGLSWLADPMSMQSRLPSPSFGCNARYSFWVSSGERMPRGRKNEFLIEY